MEKKEIKESNSKEENKDTETKKDSKEDTNTDNKIEELNDAKSDSSGEDYLDVQEDEINEKLNLTRDEKSEMEDLNDEDAEKEFTNFLQNLNKVGI